MHELDIDDLFTDAFAATARDGAGSVEVGIRLQKAFVALSNTGDEEMAKAARRLSGLALRYAEKALILGEEIDAVRAYAERDTGMAD